MGNSRKKIKREEKQKENEELTNHKENGEWIGKGRVVIGLGIFKIVLEILLASFKERGKEENGGF